MSLSLSRLSYAPIIWILLLCTGCGAGSAQDEARRQQAQEIWHKHEEVVVRALEGKQEGDQFENAVAFFADVTGIEIHVEIFTLGLLPKAEAERDLERIRTWYANNKQRLYFDQDTLSVKVASE